MASDWKHKTADEVLADVNHMLSEAGAELLRPHPLQLCRDCMGKGDVGLIASIQCTRCKGLGVEP